MKDFNFYKTHLVNGLWDNKYNYKDIGYNARPISGICIVYYLIKYFQSQNILEIGYKEGRTFMTMIEASGIDAKLTAIDIDLDVTHYNKYYKQHILNKNIKLIETPSQLFTPSGIYDFINIDGCHTYPQPFLDMVLIKNHIDENTIIMIDDYYWEGVDQSIDDFLILNTDFVPFLINPPAMFLHHKSHDATDFLDNILPKYFYDLGTLNNISYKDVPNVCTMKFWEVIKNDIKAFTLICNRLKI